MILRRCPTCHEEWWLVNKVDRRFFRDDTIDKHIDLLLSWEASTVKHIAHCHEEELAGWDSLVRSYDAESQ